MGTKTFFADVKDNLFRLVCYLRMAPDGADSRYVRDHFASRVASLDKSLRWQDQLRHALAVQESWEKLPALRKSRQQAWMQVATDQVEAFGKDMPKVLSLESGQIVLVQSGDEWTPALITTVWRAQKKGNSINETPRGCTKAIRAAILQPAQDRPHVFQASRFSRCEVFPLQKVGMHLEATTCDGSVGGFECELTPASLQAALVFGSIRLSLQDLGLRVLGVFEGPGFQACGYRDFCMLTEILPW